jgi:RimJ/RimL family protein N-acetyltransferase
MWRLTSLLSPRDLDIAELAGWFGLAAPDPSAVHFAIRPLDAATLLGTISLTGIQPDHRHAELAIAIGRAADQGHGVGREATHLILKYAFDTLALHRIGLGVYAYNARAIRFYRRLGFQHEGTLREFVRRADGWHALLLFGLLRDEWRQRNAS